MHREELIHRLKNELFDLLVIGGGATGTGIALDSATRGLKTALVEQGDFAAGTSSKSTKLIHGGVRYLELAFKQFDRGQLNLVRDALHERTLLLTLAPHLTRELPIVTPLYQRFQIPYYWLGLKVYDFLAGKTNLQKSRKVKPVEILAHFPLLKSQGLRGGVRYSDGQFDDARMNVSIALTALEEGACVLNHMAVQALIRENGRLTGAIVEDQLVQEQFSIQAKTVVNATGPFADSIRTMDDPHAEPILTASSGIHIVVDKKYCPHEVGLLFPKTEDGRVLFMLPWLGHTLIGTTDHPDPIEKDPKPSDADIQYLLDHIQKYLKIKIDRADILSSWSGLRPLVSNPKAADTAKLSRDHYVQISPSGLITITGGKWTTYRKMALDTVDQAIQLGGLNPASESKTETTFIQGGKHFTPQLPDELERIWKLDRDICRHLSRAYGDRAQTVAKIASQGRAERLVARHPFIAAEVLYAAQFEMAEHALDFLARRIRLTFLDAQAALDALPQVIELMAPLKGWDKKRKKEEEQSVREFCHRA